MADDPSLAKLARVRYAAARALLRVAHRVAPIGVWGANIRHDGTGEIGVALAISTDTEAALATATAFGTEATCTVARLLGDDFE